jgi:hypothetical protein
MDSWREELERAIADKEHEEQLMEDFFLHLRSPTLSRRGHKLEVAGMCGSMCTEIERHSMNASSRITLQRIQHMMP